MVHTTTLPTKLGMLVDTYTYADGNTPCNTSLMSKNTFGNTCVILTWQFSWQPGTDKPLPRAASIVGFSPCRRNDQRQTANKGTAHAREEGSVVTFNQRIEGDQAPRIQSNIGIWSFTLGESLKLSNTKGTFGKS